MSSFSRPFVDRLRDLYSGKGDWFDKKSDTMKSSIVIAPVATLDGPARAAIQNLMQFNGENGCTHCEHEGETCETGRGFTRVYPTGNSYPIPRTKERMLSQGLKAVEQNLEHVKGVKGASICALIPSFDIATSFPPDYMHAILLGVFRMLLSLWINAKNHRYPFYINKHFKDEIDKELQNIFSPDFITRTPRLLKYLHYWKASELRDALLHYFPILLIGRLKKL